MSAELYGLDGDAAVINSLIDERYAYVLQWFERMELFNEAAVSVLTERAEAAAAGRPLAEETLRETAAEAIDRFLREFRTNPKSRLNPAPPNSSEAIGGESFERFLFVLTGRSAAELPENVREKERLTAALQTDRAKIFAALDRLFYFVLLDHSRPIDGLHAWAVYKLHLLDGSKAETAESCWWLSSADGMRKCFNRLVARLQSAIGEQLSALIHLGLLSGDEQQRSEAYSTLSCLVEEYGSRYIAGRVAASKRMRLSRGASYSEVQRRRFREEYGRVWRMLHKEEKARYDRALPEELKEAKRERERRRYRELPEAEKEERRVRMRENYSKNRASRLLKNRAYYRKNAEGINKKKREARRQRKRE